MKRIIALSCLLVLAFAAVASADQYVNGYYRKDGTYVEPHYRSDSNGTKTDNWSSTGNVNPYTGKEGTKDPYSGNTGSGSSSGNYKWNR